jgi:hypothetical protein
MSEAACNDFNKKMYRYGPGVSTVFCGLHHVRPNNLNMEDFVLQRQSRSLDEWIRANQIAALTRFRIYLPDASLQSFHAHIGRHNNTFVDSVRTRFTGPGEFISSWISGLHNKLDDIRARGKHGYQGQLLSEQLVLKCLEDNLLRQYTFKFLERNFYRNYRERTRNKPDDALWQVWFGAGSLSWGLIIAPAHRNDIWTNDKSQMRRESYSYWTVGHVMETGLYDPDSTEPTAFTDLGAFCTFYRSVLKRVSNSTYERQICDRYLNYLSSSSSPLGEPLLIPEFRYAGRHKRHEYRLDFTILNGHTFEFTGFELSPASTHISVSKSKQTSRAGFNRELATDWQHEVSKRNAYFMTYGIPIVTFADQDLKDIDHCFAKMEAKLRARATPSVSITSALAALTRTHSANAPQPLVQPDPLKQVSRGT